VERKKKAHIGIVNTRFSFHKVRMGLSFPWSKAKLSAQFWQRIFKCLWWCKKQKNTYWF